MDELEKYDVNAFLMLCPDEVLVRLYKDLEEEHMSNPSMRGSRGIYMCWAICEVRDHMKVRGLDYE